MAMDEYSVSKQATPLCSVCIANYNGADIIGDCIDSILAQEGGHAVEIIVHDDSSTDESVALIRLRYPQVHLIESSQNVGFCVSNNRMTAVAQGEFLLLLNNDASLAPDALSTLYKHAQEQAQQGILSLPQYDWQSGQLVDRGCLLDPFYNPVPNLDLDRTEVAMVIGACLWIPAALWHKLGGFPAWFGSIAEDMYLCCAARLAGYPVQVTAESGYRHRVGFSFGGGKPLRGRLNLVMSRRRLSERNKNFVMMACHPTPLLAFTLPIHFLLLLLEGATLAVIYRNPSIFYEIYWNAIIDIWRYRTLVKQLKKTAATCRKTSMMRYLSTFTFWPHKFMLLAKFGLPRPCAS
jgi:GT2 family glycosyltransferase